MTPYDQDDDVPEQTGLSVDPWAVRVGVAIICACIIILALAAR